MAKLNLDNLGMQTLHHIPEFQVFVFFSELREGADANVCIKISQDKIANVETRAVYPINNRAAFVVPVKIEKVGIRK